MSPPSPPKVLFLLKMPPPHTGATFMNSVAFYSQVLAIQLRVYRIGISYARSVQALGRFQVRKLAVFAGTFFRLWFCLLVHRPRLIYFQPSITGATYLRDLVFLLSGRLLGRRFLLHFHGKGIREAAERNILMRWCYILGIRGQHAVVLSNSQQQDLAFLKPASISVLPNGIAPLATARPARGHNAGEFKFLFLSNLLKSKGVYHLLDAAVALQRDGHRFRIDLVGQEGDISRAELYQAIAGRGVAGSVFYHGPAYGEAKLRFFEAADAFVFPTQNDAFGLVLVEAMQFALPVVATNEGAIPEIVAHGRSGLIYDKHHPERLAPCMAALINDRQLARRMGLEGEKIQAEKFSLSHYEQGLAAIFNRVLNHSQIHYEKK